MANPTSPTEPPGRPLGTWERFVLSWAATECYSTLSFFAQFPWNQSSGTPLQSADVAQAVRQLLRSYPILRCGVSGGRTRTPRFVRHDEVGAEEVLRVVNGDDREEAELLEEGINSGSSFDGTNGPLWRVCMYDSDRPTIGPRLVLSISHLLADGTGARNLFHRLLTLLHPSSQKELYNPKDQATVLPPPIEGTLALTLPLLAKLRLAKNELIWPKLRPFLGPILPRPSPRFAPRFVTARPYRTQIDLIRLPAPSLVALKQLAHARGFGKLHPLLQCATLAAVVLASDLELAPGKKGRLASETALSLRTEAAGHTLVTGNYVSCLKLQHSLSPSDDFFDLCRAYARTIRAPSANAAGRHLIGALSLVPDPKPKVPKPGRGTTAGARVYPQTGFDKYNEAVANGRQATFEDVAVSNVLGMPPTGWEAEAGFGASWAQSNIACLLPLNVSVMSTSGGPLTLAVEWAEGNGFGRKVAERLRGVMGKLADGGGREGVTIAELGV